jgi:hypothetical protein
LTLLLMLPRKPLTKLLPRSRSKLIAE